MGSLNLDLSSLIEKSEVVNFEKIKDEEKQVKIKEDIKPEMTPSKDKVIEFKKAIQDSTSDENIEKIEKKKEIKDNQFMNVNLISVFKCITENFDHIRNATILEKEFEKHGVEKEKYLLIQKIENKTLNKSEIFLFSNLNEIMISKELKNKILDIFVYRNGFKIICKNVHIFIVRKETHEYYLENNSIKKKRIHEKNNTSEIENINEQITDVEQLKEKIKNKIPSIYNKIKNLKTIEEVKDNIYQIIDKITDIMYIMKIYDNILVYF